MSNLPTVISVSDMTKMAEAVAKSGLFGMKKPEEAMALMLIAQAEGSHPAIAVRDYHIIQGKPALKADAMLARFQSAGGRVEWKSMTDDMVAAVFSHPQGGSVEIEWTMARAQKALLGGKDMWKKFPRQMLRARVISEGIRTVFPGVIVGTYTPEEVEDFDSKPTPQPAQSRAPVIDAQPVEVKPSSFSMAGEPDPNCPFKTGDERRDWMVKAKDALEQVSTQDELDEWLAAYGGNVKFLGNFQQKAMNDLINTQRGKVQAADMDRAAKQHAAE